jgi:hypothetical protein
MNSKKYVLKGGYHAIHKWIYKNYGKAIKCENIDCEKRSNDFEWALSKGKKYEYKRENFIQLCKSCHIKYDFTEQGRKSIKRFFKGRKQTKKHIAKRVKKLKGQKRSFEFKERMREIKKGNPCPLIRKKCFQYSLENKFVREWESLTEASEFYKIKVSNITLCCQNKQKTAAGFIWKYKKNDK